MRKRNRDMRKRNMYRLPIYFMSTKTATYYANQSIAALIEEIDKVNNRAMRGGIVLEIQEIDADIDNLHHMIRYLQGVCFHASQVANSISKLRKFRTSQPRPSTVEVRPGSADATFLRLNNTNIEAAAQEISLVECLPSVTIPVHRVQTREAIPVHPLYYVENEKQFATNIAGCIVAGHIGNIAERNAPRTAACQYRQECSTLLSGRCCDYWHAPQDYLAAGQQVPQKHWRNFTAGQFVYAGRAQLDKSSHYSARHVGSRAMMMVDLRRLARGNYHEEIEARASQLAHDLLVFLVLNRAGFYAGVPTTHQI